MSSDPVAADTVGFVYYRRGLHEAALEQFRYALELNANHRNHLEPTLHYHLGLTLDALDRDDEATAAFREALAIDADFPYADDARRRVEAAGRPVAKAPRPS
jgi:tetratricopeptide (TPR) repeat protein